MAVSKPTKWAVIILAGLLAGCGNQQDKSSMQDQITGWIVECGPEPISMTFCIDFYKERGYVDVSGTVVGNSVDGFTVTR